MSVGNSASPRISVVLPAYNAEKYVRDAVGSILAQSFADFELIVIDDGSKDGTGQILGKIGDRRLRVIRHERNAGLIAGLNEGIEASTGKYLARMDADDICEPSRFLRQIEYLEMHPEVGVLGTAIRIINDQGRPGATFVMPVTPTDVEWAMPMLCPLAHPTVMIRRNLLVEIGGYCTAAVYAEDHDLWWRLEQRTTIANLPEPLLRLRKHSGNVTATQRDRHLAAGAAISKRVVDGRLGADVPLPVIQCLRSWGATNSEHASDAVQLLLELLSRMRALRNGIISSAVSRDAAIRIAYLAGCISGPRERIKALKIAHSIYPPVLPAMIHKAVRRLAPFIARPLVG